MKTEKNIIIAFLLNFSFSVFEFLGGIYTGSVAIMSDALHDLGDAASIGLAVILEKKSKKQPDEKFTYGYARYSVLSGIITTLILVFGSAVIIYNAVQRIISPIEVKYGPMIVFAVIGVVVNFFAAYFTHGGNSLNQKAVNLHMLEDVLGWAVGLAGAVLMKFTDLVIIDPLLSIGVSIFILINALKNLKQAIDIFLEKTPNLVSVNEIKEHVQNLDEVIDVHHVHVWTLEGNSVYATMHIVTNEDFIQVKQKVKSLLQELGVHHATLELETDEENCEAINCAPQCSTIHHHHHH